MADPVLLIHQLIDTDLIRELKNGKATGSSELLLGLVRQQVSEMKNGKATGSSELLLGLVRQQVKQELIWQQI